MSRKRNEFGELECVCGHEPWDHVFSHEYCVVSKCQCEKFVQAYE